MQDFAVLEVEVEGYLALGASKAGSWNLAMEKEHWHN